MDIDSYRRLIISYINELDWVRAMIFAQGLFKELNHVCSDLSEAITRQSPKDTEEALNKLLEERCQI